MDQTHKIAMTVSVLTLALCFWMIKMIGSDLTEIRWDIQIMSGHSAYQSDRIESVVSQLVEDETRFNDFQKSVSWDISSLQKWWKEIDGDIESIWNFVSDPEKCPKDWEVRWRFIELARVQWLPVWYTEYRIDSPWFRWVVVDKEWKWDHYWCFNIYRLKELW